MAALLFSLQWVCSSTRGNFHITLWLVTSCHLLTHLPGLQQHFLYKHRYFLVTNRLWTTAGGTGPPPNIPASGTARTYSGSITPASILTAIQAPQRQDWVVCCNKQVEINCLLQTRLLSGRTAFSPKEAIRPSSANSQGSESSCGCLACVS